MDTVRMIAVMNDAVDRAQRECPDALARAKEDFVAAQRRLMEVLLPFVPESDREALIAAMSAMTMDMEMGRRRS